MLEFLLARRGAKGKFPRVLHEICNDLFAVAQCWRPSVKGAEKGREFERALYRYCEKYGLPIVERSGSRTVRGVRAASGFLHESDAVLAFADVTIHFELKHLVTEVTKNDVLIFNQKGLDFLLAEDRITRRCPFYRILLSGGLVSPVARRFALLWGILVVEPDRLPFLTIYYLANRVVENLKFVSLEMRGEILEEIPRLIVPLQHRLRRIAEILDGEEALIGMHRLDWAIDHLQRISGDHYWNCLDELDAVWLEDRFDVLAEELGLEEGR